jgi:hypothetical protein
MLTPDEAAQMSRTTPRRIYQHLEAGRLHFTETDNGQLYICLNSLSNTQVEDAARDPLALMG